MSLDELKNVAARAKDIKENRDIYNQNMYRVAATDLALIVQEIKLTELHDNPERQKEIVDRVQKDIKNLHVFALDFKKLAMGEDAETQQPAKKQRRSQKKQL